jgi:hypothetical protein
MLRSFSPVQFQLEWANDRRGFSLEFVRWLVNLLTSLVLDCSASSPEYIHTVGGPFAPLRGPADNVAMRTKSAKKSIERTFHHQFPVTGVEGEITRFDAFME